MLAAGLAVSLAVLGTSAQAAARPDSEGGGWQTAAATSGPTTARGTSATGFRLPLPGRPDVVRAFVAPVNEYSAGHRGVDLAAAQGAAVLAAAAGTVRFAGSVAGRGVIVLLHADGITTEYEPLAARVRVREHVLAGEVLGSLSGRHRRCPGSCLHWGARRHQRYFDPLTLLSPLGAIRLIPAQPG
jgi:murein DD-endopeptidase MepM/ murein hydrolase activator NlpD